jgi:hypothetical protein
MNRGAPPAVDPIPPVTGPGSTDRSRRIRDAVEAALSDIILLGTEEQVRLASTAAAELVAGRPVHMHDLVVSLRAFIRQVLDLDPIPPGLVIPKQGPARPGSVKADGKGERQGQERGGNKGMGGDMAAGAGAGMGLGLGAGIASEESENDRA